MLASSGLAALRVQALVIGLLLATAACAGSEAPPDRQVSPASRDLRPDAAFEAGPQVPASEGESPPLTSDPRFDDVGLRSPPSLQEVLDSSEVVVLGRALEVIYRSYPVPYYFVSPALACYEPPVYVHPKTGEPIDPGEGKPPPRDPAEPPPGATVIERDGVVLFWYAEAESPSHAWYRVAVEEAVSVRNGVGASGGEGAAILVYEPGQTSKLLPGAEYLLFLGPRVHKPWEQHFSALFLDRMTEALRACDVEVLRALDDFLRPFQAFLEEMGEPSSSEAIYGFSHFLVGQDGRLVALPEYPVVTPTLEAGPSIFDELEGLTPEDAIAKIKGAVQDGG